MLVAARPGRERSTARAQAYPWPALFAGPMRSLHSAPPVWAAEGSGFPARRSFATDTAAQTRSFSVGLGTSAPPGLLPNEFDHTVRNPGK